MKTNLSTALTLCLVVLAGTILWGRFSERQAIAAETETEDAATVARSRPTTAEARGRAKLLHETIHGALQVMHRDFFDEETSVIPSNSLEDVFHELARGHQVELRWLTVNTDVLNTDHEPQDEFAQRAVEALRAGKSEFEATEEDVYRYAGAIRLSSQCLKCHVKRRISNRERVAGLLIKIPVRPHK